MRIRLRDAQLTLATVGFERYAKTTRLDRLWSTSIQVTKVVNVDIGREITKEKERIGEALARVDAQRERLTSQLSELEATERVLARCKGARPNHVGAAIARHKRAGRIEERDGKLYVTRPTATEQRTAV